MRARLFVGSVLTLVAMAPAAAAAADWTVSRVAGTAQVHDGSGWHALAEGDGVVPGRILRIVADGAMDLATDHATLGLSANTQLGVSAGADGNTPILRLDYGTVAVDTGAALDLRTSLLALTTDAARFTVEETGSFSRVAVLAGDLMVADLAGSNPQPLAANRSATIGLTGGLILDAAAIPAPLDGAVTPSPMSLRGALPLGGRGADLQSWSRSDGDAVTPADGADTTILPQILLGAIVGGLLAGLILAAYAFFRRMWLLLPDAARPAADV